MNQYASRKSEMREMLDDIREWLRVGEVKHARFLLAVFRLRMEEVPASTRRRWKCGR